MDDTAQPLLFSHYAKHLWPPLIGSILIGLVVGSLRYYEGFFVGVQGMFIAFLIGCIVYYACTPLIPACRAWGFAQRTGLALTLTVFFLIGEYSGFAFTLQHDNCQNLSWMITDAHTVPYNRNKLIEPCTPQTVLFRILDDRGYENVYGSSRTNSHHFRIGGIAWILFNLLDLVFQSFMTLLMVGIAVEQKPEEKKDCRGR